MANAQLQPIYNRMNQINNYHPYTADTFADWSLEAGDIVTVSRNGTGTASPISTATVRWTGRQRVTLESRGEKDRGSLAKMSARAFNSGGNGGSAYRSGYGRKTAEEKLGTDIRKTEKAIELEAWDRTQENQELRSQISVTAKAITLEVENRTKGEKTLRGEIKVEADRINQVVTAVGKNGKVTAASIVAAINEAGSSVSISADHILISGNTKINDIFRVSDVGVFVSKPMVVGWSAVNSVYLGEGRVVADSVSIRGNAGSTNALTISDITVSGNTLTITYADGRTPQTFSKATDLESAWSGSKLTVSAYQVNSGRRTTVDEYSIGFGNVTSDIHLGVGLGTPTLMQNEKYMMVPVQVNELSDGPTVNRYTSDIALNCTPVYNAVTVTEVSLADEFQPLSPDSGTRSTIFIQGKASNGNRKYDTVFLLAHPDYTVDDHYVVNLIQGSDIIGRINTDNAYNAGWSIGYQEGAGSVTPERHTHKFTVMLYSRTPVIIDGERYYQYVSKDLHTDWDEMDTWY